MPENGLGQMFHISDDTIMNGTQGTASDLSKQSEIYKNGVKGKLPDNEYDDLNQYVDAKSGANDLTATE